MQIYFQKKKYYEYVHTYNEINITNGFYIYSFIKVLIILLFHIFNFIFLCLISHFLLKLMDEYDKSLNKKINFVIAIIIILSFCCIAIFVFYILLIAIKYGLKFGVLIYIFILNYIIFFLLQFISEGISLFLFLSFEILILFYNLIVLFLNLFINDEVKVEIDKIKFKRFSFDEKLIALAGIVHSAFGLLASLVIKESGFSHMETAKRKGNEEFIYNGTMLDSIVDKSGESKNLKDYGYKILNEADGGGKESLFIIS